MARLLVLNGPNLNLLGSREPELYGTATLADVEARLRGIAAARGHEIVALQSNAEHALVDAVQRAPADGARFAIVNPGALGHTSVALRDAFLAVRLPFIEVHLSNIHAREAFRRHSYLSDIARGVVCGLGAPGYEYALAAAMAELEASEAGAPAGATGAGGVDPG